MDRIQLGDPAGDDDSDVGDVVEQGGHRFPALNWRPSKGAILLAAGLAVGLVIGLAAGYAAGERHGGTAATSATLTEPGTPALVQSGVECTTLIGRDLELGVQVTNQSTTRLTLRQVEAMLPMGGLRPVTMRWTSCDPNPESLAVPSNQVPPGAIAWFTVTFQVLAKCPQPLPVQFTVGYAQNGRLASARLPGFPDLGHVPYPGCLKTSSPLRVQRNTLEDLVNRVAGPASGEARELQSVGRDGPDDGAVVLVVPGPEHLLGVHRQRQPAAQPLPSDEQM
jgi:hypothetical protein